MSRSRLAIWNYSSVLLFTGVTVVGVLATRAVVRGLGDDLFGAYRMTADALGYLSLFELGLSGALAPLMARNLAKDDPDLLSRTVATGQRAFFVLTIAVISAAVGLLGFVDWLIPVEESSRFDLRLAWGVSVLSLLPMFFAPFRSLAEARQRGYRINLALTLQSVMIFGLSVGFARLGWGITGQALAVAVATAPLALFLVADGLKAYPDLLRAAWRRPADPVIRSELLSLAVPAFLIGLGGRISVLSDTLVVGKILDTAAAGQLFLTQRLAVMAQGQLQAVGAASWAGLAELHARGDRERFNARLVELTGLVSFLGMAGLTPITAYNHHFINLWVGSVRDRGDAVIWLGSVNALLLGLVSLWFWCFSGTGRIASMVPMTMLGSASNLIASVVFTKMFGVWGPLLGTTFGLASVSLWYLPLRLSREFGVSVAGLYRSALVPLAWGIPYAVLLRRVARSHVPAGWIGLGFEMALGALGFLALGAFAILTPAERAVWAGRFRSALPRRRSGSNDAGKDGGGDDGA